MKEGQILLRRSHTKDGFFYSFPKHLFSSKSKEHNERDPKSFSIFATFNIFLRKYL